MRIKRAIAALLCIMMLVTSVPAMSLSSGAATVANTGGVCFSVSADGNTFTITRSASGELPRQAVIIRTVNGTAIGGIHFTGVYEQMIFGANEASKTYTVSEKTSEQISNVVDRYQIGTTRSYSFEVLDLDGYLLASAARTITYDASYKFNDEWIMQHDGELLVYLNGGNYREDGYPPKLYRFDQYVDVTFPDTSDYTVIHDSSNNGYADNGVWTASTDALFARSGTASREYYSAIGDKMYTSITFTGQEIDDGYQYIQVLADNATSCDDGDECKDPDGGVYNPSLSIYKACFEINKDSGQHPNSTVEAVQMFPVRSLEDISYDEAGKKREINNRSKIYAQKFRSDVSCAGNAGALMLDPTIGNISVRFNAKGKNSDDWQFKNLKMRLALVDVEAPKITDYQISQGPNTKHNQVTITIRFSEIVKPKEGNIILHTTWGDFTSQPLTSSTYANVISFTGEITANAGCALEINGIEGNIVDQHGIGLSSFRKPNLSTYKVGYYRTPAQLSGGAYSIACQNDFWFYSEQLKNNTAASAVLATDLNMMSTSMASFTTLCDTAMFYGTFDGGGHSIFNLTVKQGNSNNVGLFSIISTSGAVRNLTLEGSCYISAKTPSYVGGIAGINLGTIEKCVVKCIVSAGVGSGDGSGKSFGGIAGINQGTVRYCLVGADTIQTNITNYWNNMTVGGVVGSNAGNLISSMFYGFYNERSYTNITRGAVCGANSGTITRCAGVHDNSNYFNSAVGSDTSQSTDATFPDSGAFFSGEVCYFLNGGVTDGTQSWYQTVDSSELPAFSGKTVYKHWDYVNDIYHTWKASYEWTWDDENGQYIVTATSRCTSCGEIYSTETVAVLSSHKDPTCEVRGVDVYSAVFSVPEYELITQTRKDYIQPLGHKYNDPIYKWNKLIDGYDVRAIISCASCDFEYYVIGDLTYETEGDPCTEDYSVIWTATFDDPLLSAQTLTEEHSALGHDWSDPCCGTPEWNGEEGAYYISASRQCLRCGGTESENVKMTEATIAPTCEDSGKTYYIAVFENPAFQTISFDDGSTSPLGHDLEIVDSKYAGCDEDGWGSHFVCKRCGKYFIYDELNYYEVSWDSLRIPAHGHDMQKSTVSEPTCESYGYTDWYFCIDCKRYFKDENGEIEIAYSDTYIDPLGHDIKYHERVAESCTEPGIKAYNECLRCKKKFDVYSGLELTDDQLIIPAGHYIIKIDRTGPYCVGYGHIECYMCLYCETYFADEEGETPLTAEEVRVQPVGHSMMHVEATEPTQDKAGNIECWYCSRCGIYFTDKDGNEEIDEDDVIIPAQPSHRQGDTDGDGFITSKDVAFIKLVLVGWGNYVFEYCDVDNDGSITAHDLAALKLLLVQ